MMIGKILFAFIFSLTFISDSMARINDDVGLIYSYLSRFEAIELQKIKTNYSSFPEKIKKVADVRADELRVKILTTDEQAKFMLGQILSEKNSKNVKNLPENLRIYVEQYKAGFDVLSYKVKKELVKSIVHEMKNQRITLSPEASNYMKNKMKFIDKPKAVSQDLKKSETGILGLGLFK